MRIAVVVPTYNRAALLVQTVESVLAQSRPADAVVIVDDGSTDDTRAVVAERFGGVPAVRYVHQENAWLGAARNTGAREARALGADALLFLDSDDLLLPHALAQLEAALSARPEAAVAYGGVQVIDADGRVTEAEVREGRYEGDVWKPLLHGNFLRSPGCALVRREQFERAGPFDEALRSCEDWDLWLRLAENGARFACAAGPPVLQYRVGVGNMSADQRRMRENVLAVYGRARARHASDPARLRLLDAGEEGYRRDLVLDDSGAVRISGRHALLRRALEASGLAGLYRRTPYGLRLAVRRLFGIGRRAP